MRTIGTILMVVVGLFLKTAESKAKDSEFDKIQTVETVTNYNGVVSKITDDIFMVRCKEHHLKLHVLNLPKAFQKDGLRIRISGDIKLTDAMDDNWGELFVVKSIQ